MHFAAYAYVGESVTNPRKYFRYNVVNTLNLLDAMVDRGVRDIVFSSTCATYGEPSKVPIAEDHLQTPVNPYGESKLMVEKILRWYGDAHGPPAARARCWTCTPRTCWRYLRIRRRPAPAHRLTPP